MQFVCKIPVYIGKENKSYYSDNIIKHYKTILDSAYSRLTAHSNKVDVAPCVWYARNKTESISRYLLSCSATRKVRFSPQVLVSEKTKPAAVCVLFTCWHQLQLLCLSPSCMQGLENVMGGRAQYASKRMLESTTSDLHCALCRILKAEVRNV